MDMAGRFVIPRPDVKIRGISAFVTFANVVVHIASMLSAKHIGSDCRLHWLSGVIFKLRHYPQADLEQS